MSWLPHLENWKTGLAAAGVVIPALLVLYFLKLRRKEMTVSSTFLWKKAIQDLQVNAPFQRLRKNLLLLLQLLLLLALLLAFARPIANFKPGPGKQTVILIDRSASMNARDVDGHTRLEEAKIRAKELVSAMKRDSSAMVIAFDDSAETIQAFTTDTSALRGAIDRIQGTDRRTRLKLAYQLAEAQANFNPEQLRSDQKDPPEVRLYSDGRALDASELSVMKARLVYEKIGSDTARNIAVVALSAKRNFEKPTQVQVFAHLANFGPEPAEAPVQLSVDGEVVEVGGAKTQKTLLLPSRWDEPTRDAWESAHPGIHPVDGVSFELDLDKAALIKVEQMNKAGDDLPADDMAQVMVPSPKSLAVLLVSPGNPFLEKVLKSLDLKKADTRAPEVYEQESPTQYDVIIFDRYKPTFLPSAGNFIYFLDGLRAALPDMQPKMRLEISMENGAPVLLKNPGILDWKRDHPILKDVALGSLYVAEAVKLKVPIEDEVLLDGYSGPLMVLDHTGKYTNLVIAFDSLQSDFPLGPSWPIFMYNAMQYLAIGQLEAGLQPGATPTVPRGDLQKIGDPATIKLKCPDGSVVIVPVPASGDFVLPALNHVGLYTTDPPVPQFERMAVNLLDANESNLLPADKPPGDTNATVEDQKAGRARVELWWWIALIAGLPLLLIEWWVYTRRVHL